MTVDHRVNFGYGEFYITNVCNLNCSECIRMNNFHFTGHQKWEDYEDQYTELSKKVSFAIISISGGEAMLNPSFKSWVVGVRKLWPDASIWIGTNGSRLNFIEDLYPLLLDNRTNISISAHGRLMFDEITSNIHKLLQAPLTIEYLSDFSDWVELYNRSKGSDWPDCSTKEDFDQLPDHIKSECFDQKIDPDGFLSQSGSISYKDKNGIKILYNHSNLFRNTVLQYAESLNQFTVYDSDPEESHAVCFSSACHSLHKGKLYKCAHMAVLPEFMEQFNVRLSDEDKKLLLNYKPLESTASFEEVVEFNKKIKKSIPQCKLCPSNLTLTNIEASTKKKKIIKIKKQ